MNNKLFELHNITDSSIVSKVKRNREYLISDHVKDELNTYRMWNKFEANDDTYMVKYEVNGNKVKETAVSKHGMAVRSLLSRYGAVLLGDANNIAEVYEDASNWRIGLNAPLMENPEIRKKMKINSGCSIKELVEASEAGALGREIYSYADFMYCKHLGKMPNTYMITLRRFPVPVDDYIASEGIGEQRTAKEISSQNMQSIGCMVTWLGTPGNEMGDVLKYSVSMPYKEQTARWEDSGVNADNGSGILNSIAAAMDPAYRKAYTSGHGGNAFNAHIGKMFGVDAQGNYPMGQHDQNKIYGPIDAIKTVAMRSDEGLKFEQSVKLTFEYELRSYDGINGRQAMLELISNILNVTYSTGTFWGGGYRGSGMHQNNIFNNLNVFKTSGGFTDFVDAMQKDYQNLSGMAQAKIANAGGGIQGLINLAKQALNQLGGMIIGGALNRLGRPVRAAANSLLSPAPIGLWHVTIGNPHHPIMSMGNMILKNTTIEHTGPLGLDEFPTGIKVTCELKPGRGRDIREIEALYMKGNDRIYTSMSEKVFNMYAAARTKTTTKPVLYKDSEFEHLNSQNLTIPSAVEVTPIGTDTQTETQADPKQAKKKTPNGSNTKSEDSENTITDWDLSYTSERTLLNEKEDLESIKSKQDILQKYFGETDVYSIYFASAEQERGATVKKVKQTNTGAQPNADTRSASGNNNSK